MAVRHPAESMELTHYSAEEDLLGGWQYVVLDNNALARLAAKGIGYIRDSNSGYILEG